jgi:DNA-binding NtrC family response regulator
MNVKGGRIVLYSAAAESDAELLCRQLAAIGYPAVTPLQSDQPLDNEAEFSAVVMLITDPSRAQESILAQLPRFGSLPVCVLLSSSCAQRFNTLVEACDEVAAWPCGNQELNFRLGMTESRDAGRACPGHDLFVKMNILGHSPEFLQVLDKVCKITQCDAPVYIDGETGTGKELIARAIHYMSARRDHPFIAANCGAIPDQLVENEFFGHDRGAYTDARDASGGMIGEAEGGTLFLDEIENLSIKGQVVLLRFLESMSYRPLGSKSAKTANLRIITATNESIAELVEQGAFRKDLYYRVNIMNILLPPLRERSGDIELLAQYFIRRYQAQYGQPRRELCPDSLEALKYYDWPGNVRELENVLHREFLLAEGDRISLSEMESMNRDRRDVRGDRRMQNLFDMPMVKAKTSLVNDFEARYLRASLERARGNISEAARRAGKERRTFTRLLQKYSLDGAHFKPS